MHTSILEIMDGKPFFCMLCSSDSHASIFMHETNEEMVRHHWAVIFTIAEPNDGF